VLDAAAALNAECSEASFACHVFGRSTSAAHGLVMLIATPMQKGLAMTFIEGVPFFAIAAVLAWLRPRGAISAANSFRDRVTTPHEAA
jgi:hypothetical protein